MVAVEDSSSSILGYAMWEVPQSSTMEDSDASKEQHQHEKVPRPQFIQPELRLLQFKKLRRLLVEDAIERFGPDGTKDVRSKSILFFHRKKYRRWIRLRFGCNPAYKINSSRFIGLFAWRTGGPEERYWQDAT